MLSQCKLKDSELGIHSRSPTTYSMCELLGSTLHYMYKSWHSKLNISAHSSSTGGHLTLILPTGTLGRPIGPISWFSGTHSCAFTLGAACIGSKTNIHNRDSCFQNHSFHLFTRIFRQFDLLESWTFRNVIFLRKERFQKAFFKSKMTALFDTGFFIFQLFEMFKISGFGCAFEQLGHNHLRFYRFRGLDFRQGQPSRFRRLVDFIRFPSLLLRVCVKR